MTSSESCPQSTKLPSKSTCRAAEIGKIGLTPDAARDWLVKDLTYRGVPSSNAEAGTLVHFALRNLCPGVPNTTGIRSDRGQEVDTQRAQCFDASC